MTINKQTGQMYPWVTHTWNTIKGKCPHDCLYCYMKIYKQPELHLDEKEFKTDLGQGKTIFVGSSCDMWAKGIPREWISRTLDCCHPGNKYLFQTKNPSRFSEFLLPKDTLLGITLESNRCSNTSKSPCPQFRVRDFQIGRYPKMVSIEPIMDFDLDELVAMIKLIQPVFVSIGADSKGHHLPEPTGDKIRALIVGLQQFTEVKQKSNLSRLL